MRLHSDKILFLRSTFLLKQYRLRHSMFMGVSDNTYTGRVPVNFQLFSGINYIPLKAKLAYLKVF